MHKYQIDTTRGIVNDLLLRNAQHSPTTRVKIASLLPILRLLLGVAVPVGAVYLDGQTVSW
jgi:hypothetical protein